MTRLLLDTHALVWWDQGSLPAAVVRRIRSAGEVFVSAASAWEIAIKSGLGKIVVKGTVADAISDYGFSELPISVAHADGARSLPQHHRDPFDRLLIIQARLEGLTLVSRDSVLAKYGVAVVWS